MANLDAFTAERLLNGEAENPALEGFLETLRTPSHPTEVIAEREVVAKMIEGFKQAAPPSGAGRGSKSARRFTRRVATGAAVAVLSLGGVAAAATGVNPFSPLIDGSPDPSLETVSATESSTTTRPENTTTTTSTSTSTSTTRGATSGSTSSPADEDSSAPSTSIECADGNHGKTVSSIAKTNTPGKPETPGENHGATVREAAQSDCGKDASENEDEDSEQDDASKTTAASSDGSTTSAPKPAKPETGNGNGNGNGNTGRGK